MKLYIYIYILRWRFIPEGIRVEQEQRSRTCCWRPLKPGSFGIQGTPKIPYRRSTIWGDGHPTRRDEEDECHGLTRDYQGGVRPHAGLPDHAYAYICMSQGGEIKRNPPEVLRRRVSQTRVTLRLLSSETLHGLHSRLTPLLIHIYMYIHVYVCIYNIYIYEILYICIYI